MSKSKVLELKFDGSGVGVDRKEAMELVLPEVEKLGESIIKSVILDEAPHLTEDEVVLVMEEVKRQLLDLYNQQPPLKYQ